VASPVNPAEDVSSINGDRDCTTSDPFKEVFWNPADFFDNRMCSLCGEVGDFPPDSCGRLLWIGLNEWIHCNCALWSSEVFELENGALQQIGNALHRGKSLRCPVCLKKGATVSCCKSGCKQSYHFLCAREDNCSLLQAQKMFCPRHELSERQKDEIQHDMKIGRKVFVDIEWIQKREQKACVDDITIFVGSL
ncbi:Histone-lysine N-methyltransferase 2A, partial [Orchesella cincta]